MTIANYDELKVALENTLGRDTSARHDEFIESAILSINLDLVGHGGIRAMEGLQDLVINKALSGGTSSGTNTITLTPSTALTAYVLGTTYKFTAAATNTSATTLNISGLGAKNIKKGEDGAIALAGNEIINGHDYHVYYDGTQFRIVPPGGIPLPARFGGFDFIYLDGSPVKELDAVTDRFFYQTYMSDELNKPDAYMILGESVVFGPNADANYVGKAKYFQKFAQISSSTTNWIIDNAYPLWLYGALIHSAPFSGDDQRLVMWSAMYDDWLGKLDRANDREKHPPGMRRRNRVPIDKGRLRR
jgi:hypothetical protein